MLEPRVIRGGQDATDMRSAEFGEEERSGTTTREVLVAQHGLVSSSSLDNGQWQMDIVVTAKSKLNYVVIIYGYLH